MGWAGSFQISGPVTTGIFSAASFVSLATATGDAATRKKRPRTSASRRPRRAFNKGDRRPAWGGFALSLMERGNVFTNFVVVDQPRKRPKMHLSRCSEACLGGGVGSTIFRREFRLERQQTKRLDWRREGSALWLQWTRLRFHQVTNQRILRRRRQGQLRGSTHAGIIAQAENKSIPILSLLDGGERQARRLDFNQ